MSRRPGNPRDGFEQGYFAFLNLFRICRLAVPSGLLTVVVECV